MTKDGPKNVKRPRDVIGNAVRVMEIATGQREEEREPEEPENETAGELGREGESRGPFGEAAQGHSQKARRSGGAQKAAHNAAHN